jgi:hypothetical protein
MQEPGENLPITKWDGILTRVFGSPCRRILPWSVEFCSFRYAKCKCWWLEMAGYEVEEATQCY